MERQTSTCRVRNLLRRLAAVALALSGGLLLKSPVQAGGPTWSQFRYGPNHAGFTLEGPRGSSLRRLRHGWIFARGSGSDLVLGSLGQVFFTARGRLYAADAYTGRPVWSRPWNGVAHPAYYLGSCATVTCSRFPQTIFVSESGRGGGLRALDAYDGRTQWSFDHASLSWPTVGAMQAPRRTEGVYVSSRDGSVFAFPVGRARPVWRASVCPQRDCMVTSATPAVSGGLLYVTSSDGRLYAIRTANGRIAWRAALGRLGRAGTSIAVAAGRVLVATGDTEVVAVNASNGRKTWAFTGSGHATSGMTIGLAAAHGLVYIGGLGAGRSRPELLTLRASTGRLRWKFRVGRGASLDPSVAGATVYATDTGGDLYALNALSGRHVRLLARIPDYRQAYPVIMPDWLYVGCDAFSVPG